VSSLKHAEARIDDPAWEGIRLDAFVSECLGLFSRSQAKARIVEARVNEKPVRIAKKLKSGDLVAVDYRDAPPPDVTPQDIPLAIVFENDEVIVIDKPQGMVVHPGSGNPSGTLVNALLFHCAGLQSSFGGEDPRPGIVHRLDKETSGVIIAAKNARAHESLSLQFKTRKARKLYLALLIGSPQADQGRIETRIIRDPNHRKQFICAKAGGRIAITDYRILRRFGGHALAALSPRTGRTHQLRAHMRHMGTPILGDPIYARKDPLFPDATLMLHAKRLEIAIPGEDLPRRFVAPLPERFKTALIRLQSLSPR